MKTVILGLGNALRTDSGAGVYASRRARELVSDKPIDVKEASVAGFALLDLLEGYDRAVILDAAKTPDRKPGEIAVQDASDLSPTLHLVAGHQMDLPTSITLAQRLGHDFPEQVSVVSIQIDDDGNLGTECTPAVADAIEPAAQIAVELAVGSKRVDDDRFCRASGDL